MNDAHKVLGRLHARAPFAHENRAVYYLPCEDIGTRSNLRARASTRGRGPGGDGLMVCVCLCLPGRAIYVHIYTYPVYGYWNKERRTTLCLLCSNVGRLLWRRRNTCWLCVCYVRCVTGFRAAGRCISWGCFSFRKLIYHCFKRARTRKI